MKIKENMFYIIIGVAIGMMCLILLDQIVDNIVIKSISEMVKETCLK